MADVTSYSYDDKKRPVKIQAADNTSRSFVWDAADNMLGVTDEPRQDNDAPARWREFLRTILRIVIFQGTEITIEARILLSGNRTGGELRFAVAL